MRRVARNKSPSTMPGRASRASRGSIEAEPLLPVDTPIKEEEPLPDVSAIPQKTPWLALAAASGACAAFNGVFAKL